MVDIFYGLRDQEQLDVEVGDVIERHFEGLSQDIIPDMVRIYEYATVNIPVDAVNALDFVLEMLDEEYADPDTVYSTPATPAMLEAEQVFMKTVLAEYVPYDCEQTGTFFDVNPHQYLTFEE